MPLNKNKYEKDRSRNFAADHGGGLGTGEGDVIWYGAGEVVAGSIYYLGDAEEGGGAWYAADADTAPASTNLLGVALGNGTASSVGMLLRGTVTVADPGDGAGNVLYLSTAARTCSRSAPTASGDFIRVVGYQIANGGHIFFNPGSTVVKIA